MKREQFLKNLKSPTGVVDVVLDTDAFNEVDDRYAIAYLLRSKDRLNTKAIYAAPFISDKVTTVGEGMQTSYDTILEILNLLGETSLSNHLPILSCYVGLHHSNKSWLF